VDTQGSFHLSSNLTHLLPPFTFYLLKWNAIEEEMNEIFLMLSDHKIHNLKEKDALFLNGFCK